MGQLCCFPFSQAEEKISKCVPLLSAPRGCVSLEKLIAPICSAPASIPRDASMYPVCAFACRFMSAVCIYDCL